MGYAMMESKLRRMNIPVPVAIGAFDDGRRVSAMLQELTDTIQQIFVKHQIAFEFEAAGGNRFLFHWNRVMYDPGLSAQNVMLDYTIDPEDGDIYLGLIRIPAEYRGKGIGMELVEAFKRYATETGYAIILESADENTDFWLKEHFATFLHEDYGFWIMGYGGDDRQKWLNNWRHIKSGMYPEHESERTDSERNETAQKER